MSETRYHDGPVAWATVQPMMARWRLSITTNQDGTWDVTTSADARPHHARRRVWWRDVPQAIVDVAQQCEAEAGEEEG